MGQTGHSGGGPSCGGSSCVPDGGGGELGKSRGLGCSTHWDLGLVGARSFRVRFTEICAKLETHAPSLSGSPPPIKDRDWEGQREGKEKEEGREGGREGLGDDGKRKPCPLGPCRCPLALVALQAGSGNLSALTGASLQVALLMGCPVGPGLPFSPRQAQPRPSSQNPGDRIHRFSSAPDGLAARLEPAPPAGPFLAKRNRNLRPERSWQVASPEPARLKGPGGLRSPAEEEERCAARGGFERGAARGGV